MVYKENSSVCSQHKHKKEWSERKREADRKTICGKV